MLRLRVTPLPKGQVYPYRMWHLQTTRLIELERKYKESPESLTELEQEAVQKYIALSTNAPRYDAKVTGLYAPYKSRLELEREKLQAEQAISSGKKTRTKVDAAQWLLDNKFYDEVARINALSSHEAIWATTSVNEHWSAKKRRGMKTLMVSRSTKSYDILQRFDEYFLKMPLGLVNMESKKYSMRLV